MTAEFIAEVQAEWQGLLARPVRMGDERTQYGPVAAPVAPAAPVAAVQAVQAAPVAAGPADGFRTLSARFPGRCLRCSGRITVGQTIRYGGKGQTYHLLADCQQLVAAPVAPVASAPAPAQLAPVATSPLAFAMAAAKPRRTRQAAPQAAIAAPVAVSVAAADDWF